MRQGEHLDWIRKTSRVSSIKFQDLGGDFEIRSFFRQNSLQNTASLHWFTCYLQVIKRAHQVNDVILNKNAGRLLKYSNLFFIIAL